VKREDAPPIEVYCDDARHARGKVAKLGHFDVIENPMRGLYWTFLPWQGKRFARHPSNRHVAHIDGRGREGLSWAYRCPLCSRRPALTDEHLQRFADSWAEAGHSRVSLSVLDAYAARLGTSET
jgi:hypothetical protein